MTPKTKKNYDQIINQLIDQVGYTMPITKINADDIRAVCLRHHLANATKKNYRKHLKAFFRWVEDRGLIDTNPCDEVKTPKPKDNLVDKIIEEADLKRLFKAFRGYQRAPKKAGLITSDNRRQFWFKPLVTLAFYTGLRRKEILQLQWTHVNLQARFLRVTDTKNGRERSVPIFDPLYWRLRAWRKLMGNPQNGLVFPSPRSTPDRQYQLTGNYVSDRFKFYTRKAKFKESIHFHGLRHSCATFLLRNGFNVIEVKNMLGHSSLEITNKYVHLVANDLLATANRNGLITR